MIPSSFVWQEAKATGVWSYNGRISFWAVPPARSPEERLTWAEFAHAEGVDPHDWDLSPPASP